MFCPDIFSRFLSFSFSQEHLRALTSMLSPNVDKWNLQTCEQKIIPLFFLAKVISVEQEQQNGLLESPHDYITSMW